MLHRSIFRKLSCNKTGFVRQNHSLQEEYLVRQCLCDVIEPVTQQPLVSLGIIEKIMCSKHSANINLQLLVPGYPYTTELCQRVHRALKRLTWIERISVNVSEVTVESKPQLLSTGLAKVKHVIAISSCKGGVGKSTTALNTALSFAKRGLKVGLLDSDVYGPSLPAMVTIKDRAVRKSSSNSKFVEPLDGPRGLKVMSFGYVNPKAGVKGAGGREAALMRGPVATRVINQLALMTDWGYLDYLVVDMPPGTGDVQITLCQSVMISGACIVTLPHTLSLLDASKGVDMFSELRVPVLAIVENMAYFRGDDGKIYHPFGHGGRETIQKTLLRLPKDQLSEVPYHSFPISSILSQLPAETVNHNNIDTNSGTGVLQHPSSDIASEYDALVDSMISSLFKFQLNAQLTPSINYDATRGIILRYYSADKAEEFILHPSRLRARSPTTGELVENESNFLKVVPVRFEMKGNYGVAIHWSDGHYADIFPFSVLRRIVQENSQTNSKLT